MRSTVLKRLGAMRQAGSRLQWLRVTDAAAVGNAAGRVLTWRASEIPSRSFYPDSMWASYNFETPPPMITITASMPQAGRARIDWVLRNEGGRLTNGPAD
jgi:hypothetical protein